MRSLRSLVFFTLLVVLTVLSRSLFSFRIEIDRTGSSIARPTEARVRAARDVSARFDASIVSHRFHCHIAEHRAARLRSLASALLAKIVSIVRLRVIGNCALVSLLRRRSDAEFSFLAVFNKAHRVY